MSIYKLLFALTLSFVPLLAQALNTSITLIPDSSITPSSGELVTFGLPLARGDVFNTDDIHVASGSTELKISVQEGLRWHWLDNSLRSVTIQLQGVDMTGGDVTITVTDAGRNTMQDLAVVAPDTGWTRAGPLKANLPFPRIFALHDLTYLAGTGIIPPYVPGSVTEGVGKLQSDQFDANFGALDYSTSSASSWLFDRATAMLKAYMVTGDLKFLKEGFLAKQFYFSHVRNDGTPPDPIGGSGCWLYGSVNCADGKYIYTQPAKLAWALFGDTSQWDNQLINNMALQADLGNWQSGTRDPYSEELEGFTERGAGIAGLADVGAYEITGDTQILAHIRERVESLRDMQQTAKPWDEQYGWTPMSGAFTHSWARHEGDAAPPSGTSDDRRFSPWMSENIADFLWQAYQISSDPALAATIGEMLRQLGNAIDLYGFMSSYEAGEGVRATFTRRPGLTGSLISCASPDNLAVELMYSGSAYASPAALVHTQQREGGYVDQHNVEVVLPLALAFHFETDAAAKQRLMARIEHLKRQWTSNPTKNCASIFAAQVYRLFNWQHRSNSISTWDWVKGEAGVSITEAALPKLEYPGYVWVSTAPCSDGKSWHYQCEGKWVTGDTYAVEQFIAVCVTTDGVNCANEGVNRRWTAQSLLTELTYVRNCPTKPENLAAAGPSSCPSVKYIQSGGVTGRIAAPKENSIVRRAAAITNDTAVVKAAATTEGLVAKASAALNMVVNSAGAVSPPVGAVGEVLFWNATASVVDQAPPLSRHFWAGLPDVNGDGCLDMFAGTHMDSAPSSMFIQGRDASGCSGRFSYISTDQSAYTQAGPASPRITSRYIWGNWYGHPQGLWSFFGHDVDGGSGSARYVATPDSRVGEIPQYEPKTRGCFGARVFCFPLDVDGNGTIELATRSRRQNNPEMGYIRDLVTGNVLIRPDAAGEIYGDSMIIFDIDNDGLPEIVNPKGSGYWKYNVSTGALDWQADRFPVSLSQLGANENHAVPLDYDADGDLDLYIGSGAYTKPSENVFKVAFYRNEGNGSFIDVTEAAGFTVNILKNTYYHTTYANTVAADLNLDGYPDLVFAGEGHAPESAKSTVVLLMNNGNGTFTVNRQNNFGLFVNNDTDGGKAWVNHGDYDNDGLIDIVKTHGVSSPVHASIALFRNVTNTGGNAWMRVHVRGLGVNTDGLHTRLVFKDSVTQQIITSYQVGAFTMGYQNLIPHAGLGKRAIVDLEVHFAHGVSYTYQGIATNRDVVVFHDGSILDDYHPGDVIPMNGSSAAVNTTPLDPVAFGAGLRALEATSSLKEDGAMLVQVGPTTFSLRPGPLRGAVHPLPQSEAVFTTRGTLANPFTYRISTIYPDGRAQDLVPYVYQIEELTSWLQGENLIYTIDSVNGQLYVRNNDGRLIWRGIPDYSLRPVNPQADQLTTGSDYNGDGLPDVAFQSGAWNQVIFNLGL